MFLNNSVIAIEFGLNFNYFNDFDYFDKSIKESIEIQMNQSTKVLNQNKTTKNKQKSINFSIIKYIYPIILTVGIIGNILSIILLIKTYKRKKYSCKFLINLIVLSIADLSVLIFGCFREYSDNVLEWKLRSMNIYSCKMIYFCCYLFSCLSSYIHAYISYERWYAIVNPIKSKINRLNNKIYILALFILSIWISLPFAYHSQIKEFAAYNKKKLNETKLVRECVISEPNHTSEIVLAVIDFIFYCLLPFLVASTFSISSLVHLFSGDKKQTEVLLLESRRRFASYRRANSSVSQSSPNILEVSQNKRQSNDELFYRVKSRYLRSSEMFILNINQWYNLKLSIMLLALPVNYLITTLPVFIMIVLQFLPLGDNSPNRYKTEMSIARTFMYVNNSINIFLYVLMGKSLRKDVFEVVANFVNQQKK